MRIIQQSPSNPDRGTGSLNEIDRISVGEKAQTQYGKEYPVSSDHFIARGDYQQQFNALYGDAPTQLPILFVSSDTDHACDERLELRDKAGKLFAYGDGVTFWVYKEAVGKYVESSTQVRPTLMADSVSFLQKQTPADQHKNIKWKSVLRLRFVLRDFPVLGYFQFTTGGEKTTIPAIRNVFDECLKTFGTVQYLPFVLTVKKVKSNTPGVSTRYPIVSLTPAMSLEEGLALRRHLESGAGNDTLNFLLNRNQSLSLPAGEEYLDAVVNTPRLPESMETAPLP